LAPRRRQRFRSRSQQIRFFKQPAKAPQFRGGARRASETRVRPVRMSYGRKASPRGHVSPGISTRIVRARSCPGPAPRSTCTDPGGSRTEEKEAASTRKLVLPLWPGESSPPNHPGTGLSHQRKHRGARSTIDPTRATRSATRRASGCRRRQQTCEFSSSRLAP